MSAYDTYINADTYFVNRLHVIAWRSASTANKTIALAEATQRINHLRFSGIKVEIGQELEFPRYYGDDPEGDEVIPDDIKIATYELAFALLDGVDPDLEYENLRVTQSVYSSVRITQSPTDIPPHTAAGIPSVLAWRHLLPYLAPDRTIRMHRVS